MSFINDFGKKFSETSQNVAKKAKDVAETSNLKLQIKEEERKIKSYFTELGEQYYVLYGEDAQGELKKTVDIIEGIKSRIALLEARIEEVENSRICPNCGDKIPEKGQFCVSCGTKYPEKTQIPEVVAEYKTCVKCGAQILEDVVYCTKCGGKQIEQAVEEDAGIVEASAAEEPVADEPTAEEVVTEESVKEEIAEEEPV